MSQPNITDRAPAQNNDLDWAVLQDHYSLNQEELNYLQNEIRVRKEWENLNSEACLDYVVEKISKIESRREKNEGLGRFYSRVSSIPVNDVTDFWINANIGYLGNRFGNTTIVFIQDAQHEAELIKELGTFRKYYGTRPGDYNPTVSSRSLESSPSSNMSLFSSMYTCFREFRASLSHVHYHLHGFSTCRIC